MRFSAPSSAERSARTVSDGDDSDRLIAILAGATIGAIIGHEIGDEMDDNDRACFGHSLELLADGRNVRWDGDRGADASTC